MLYRTLGRTELRVSVMGMGCGGPSKAGRSTHGDDARSVGVIRTALEQGVNLIDTAESYNTEALTGEAIAPFPRDQIIVSTKKTMHNARKPITPADLVTGLENSLRRLGTTYVDIYHLHGVSAKMYPYARDEIVPAMLRLRDQGKIRFLGVTEALTQDPGHEMLQLALLDECWDVMMVGFNVLNQSARDRVLPTTRANNIGTLIMFAVRKALTRPQRLREVLDELIEQERVDPAWAGAPDPLGFLAAQGVADTVTEAAYRFCAHEPGADVVLSGTGSPEHLKQNLRSLCKPDVPADMRDKLVRMFAKVDNVSGS